MAEENPTTTKKPGAIKVWGYKGGQFSKTASLHSVAWFIVLALYTAQSLFQGATIKTTWFDWTIPAFSAAAAGVILGLVSSTYLGNNYLKNGKATEAAVPVVHG